MKINANYRLTAASKESKELVEMAKAALKDALNDVDEAAYRFGFAFSWFYEKKYSKQKLVSICLEAICDILELNANLAERFYEDISNFSYSDYNDFVVDQTEGRSKYNVVSVILIALDYFTELNKELYRNFVEYVKANSYKDYKDNDANYSSRAYRNLEPNKPFEI